ncbi:anaphase-promoting complex subunit 5-like [Vespa mandarinia]|uniref:anaphase-promoting complex subunit 5-like n=1 Tax=Vespa mandarinia TaxID=7446 RepID=UPI0016135D01|nr:anaphase-promoting complex subunit 5-like [Vespa mandarinia]
MSKELVNIDGNVKRVQKENLTPYKVAIVMLIKEYCNESRKAIVVRRDFCLAAVKLIQSPDMEMYTLLHMLYSSEHIYSFGHELELQLNTLLDKGIEGFLDLFDSLGRLMKSTLDHAISVPLLNKNSVLGLYVRRIIIFFEKLPFDQAVLLYEDLKNYVKKKSRSPENTDISSCLKLDEPYIYNNKSTTVWSGRQAELLVAQQAHALKMDEHKAMSPVDLQILIRKLLRSSPYYAEAHYLSYLNCLRINEYCSAIDSLYHCFDRLAPSESRSTPEDKSRTLRYAALNLAVLHAHFNHKKVAEEALKEAIMMAQEAGDNVCLQLAHAWMYYLTSEKKGPLIERSLGKASMLGITYTTGLGLIALSHYSTLESKPPSQIFETLMKSDVLNCQHSMIDLMSLTYSEKSALWAYYGKMELSSVCAQLLLLHNAGNKKQNIFNGTSTCQAVVNVANILVEFGEYDLVDIVLAHAKERFPNHPSNKMWMLCEQLYEFTKMMRREKWSEADAIASRISSLDPLESKFRQAEVSLAKGDYPNTLHLIDNIEKIPNITPENRVRAMILLSEIMCVSFLSGNETVGINSLVILNKALELATHNHLSFYEALIKMHLANIQLLMGLPSLAMNLVDEAITHTLAHGGCYEQGRALILYAKCLVGTATSTSTKLRKEMILNAIKALSKARDHFNKVEAFGKIRNVLSLQSIMYNEIDMKFERNQCSFELRQFEEQFPTKLDNICLY